MGEKQIIVLIVLLHLLYLRYFYTSIHITKFQYCHYDYRTQRRTLHKNCPYSELFWSIFSRIQSEYGKIRNQSNSEYGHLNAVECSATVMNRLLMLVGLKLRKNNLPLSKSAIGTAHNQEKSNKWTKLHFSLDIELG